MKLIALIGFPAIALVFTVLLVNTLFAAIQKTDWPDAKKKKVKSRLIYGLIIWAIFISCMSISGFTGSFDLFPLNAMPVMLLPLIIVIILLSTQNMTDILRHADLKLFTQLQVFRVFVEIILWLLFLQNLIPIQMSFEGRNWDILAGITSLLAAHYFIKSKGWMIAWNLIGLALLLNIIIIAILSMPTSLRVFHNEPANIIVTHFPYIFLPAFLVPMAYTLHFMSLKKLLIKS